MTSNDRIQRLLRALDVARTLDPHMPVQYLLALLAISRNPGCSPGDLVVELGTSSASAARIVAALSTWERVGKRGHGLIHITISTADRRRRELWMTPEGQQLIARLEEALS